MQSDLKKIDRKLDSLADIMTEGFERIYDKIDGLEARADKSDGRMDKIESDVKSIKSELKEVRTVQDQHTLTLNQHTETLAEHTIILRRLDGDTEMLINDDLAHTKRIKKLEKMARLRK